MLDLQLDREGVTPKDAATIILVRDTPGAKAVEVFCLERSKESRFMGGAVVFPGGKLDESDASPDWLPLTTATRVPRAALAPTEPFTNDLNHLRSLAITAERETLEEAALLHVMGGWGATQDDLFRVRTELATNPDALRSFLRGRQMKLNLAALCPFSRWITPTAEERRFDTRFFVAIAPKDQTGAHDEKETVASFWATPAEVLRRYEAGEVKLAPPTHRTMWLLAKRATTKDVMALANESSLDPICPRLVQQKDEATGADLLALTLPGDPEHPVKEARVRGSSRYVLRGDRWQAEDAPRAQ